MAKNVKTGGDDDSFFKRLFGRGGRQLEKVEMPAEIKNFNAALKAAEPALGMIVKEFRQLKGAGSRVEIALLVDNKPCTLSFMDAQIPQEIIQQVAHELNPLHPVPVHTPQPDLVKSIEDLLRAIYKEPDRDILGAIYSPHQSAALKIGEILERARDRDRQALLKAITDFTNTFKH